MYIKDIPRNEYFRIKRSEIDANIFDDGKWFCATSYDDVWCCTGVVVDHANNTENQDPLLQVNQIYKVVSKS